MKTKKQKMFENIYDIICRTAFEEEARKEFDKFLKDKDCEWNGDNDTITIGKHFTITLN